MEILKWIEKLYPTISLVALLVIIILFVYSLFCKKKKDITLGVKKEFVIWGSLICSLVALCRSYPIPSIFDYIGLIVGVLSLLVTVLVGWNIYAVIDFKKQSKQIVDKADEVINSHAILSKTLDKRFEDFRNEIDIKISKAKDSAGLMESYKRAVSFMEYDPESSFRDFIEIKIQSDKLEEIKLSELALSMAEYIARREELKPKVIESVKKITEQQRNTFSGKAINLINSLSSNSCDFEDLRKFISQIYGSDGR